MTDVVKRNMERIGIDPRAIETRKITIKKTKSPHAQQPLLLLPAKRMATKTKHSFKAISIDSNCPLLKYIEHKNMNVTIKE